MKCHDMVCLVFLIFVLVFSGCTKNSNIPGNGDNNSGGTIPVEGIELVSGAPVSAVMEGGLAPLSFDKVISNAVMGAVYISSEKFPDLFVICPTGISGGMRGTVYCEYDGMTADGRPIYKQPVKINDVPWNVDDTVLRVIELNGKVYAIFMNNNKIRVSEFDYNTMSFGAYIANNTISGIDYPLTSFEIVPSSNGVTADLYMFCYNVKTYKPEMDDVTESYYDSAGIYRGTLPGGMIYKTTISTVDWTTTIPNVELYCNNTNLIIAPMGIAHVKTSDIKGVVLGNKFGTFKFLDDKHKSLDYIYNMSGDVMQNPCVTSRICSFGENGDIISSGEGALYYYKAMGRNSDGTIVYEGPKTVMMRNGNLYAGSLCVPTVVDWNGDGVLDIVAGNSEGRLLYFKNYGTNLIPAFGEYEYICSNGKPICFRAGYYEIQGPLEAGWGYLCPTVVDWNGDGLPDVVFSSNEGKFEYMLNEGSLAEPRLGERHSMTIDGLELYGMWRVRPAVASIEGTLHIAIMDDTDAVHLYMRRTDEAVLDMGRLHLSDGNDITGYRAATAETLGERGRSKLEFVDWDGDGDYDLIIGTPLQSSFPSPSYGLPWSRYPVRGMNVLLLENIGNNNDMRFAYPKQFMFRGADFDLGSHANSPAMCMLGDTSFGPNLLVGCESGKFYFFHHYDLTTISLW